jgi:subtilisin family serine protease
MAALSEKGGPMTSLQFRALIVALVVVTAISIPALSSNQNMIVVFKPQATYAGYGHVADILQKTGYLNYTRKYSLLPAVAASVDQARLSSLKGSTYVQAIYPDSRARIQLKESIPQIAADLVQKLGVDGKMVKVCLVDTGIEHEHDFLKTPIDEYDFIDADKYADDKHGHGTHVAGIVSSSHSVYRGVAPGVHLLVAKVLDADGDGAISGVIAGIEWCVNHEADVISMSLGDGEFYVDYCDDEPMSMAVNRAVELGATVVVAAGNGGNTSALSAPACASKAISVGAIDKAGRRLQFSNGGQRLTLMAPGGAITSTDIGGGFATRSGTSMSTPHVAGVIALLLQANPNLTPAQIKENLQKNAKDLGATGFDNGFGFGRVNAKASYDAATSACATCAQPQMSSAGLQATVSNTWVILSAFATLMGLLL